MGEDKVNGKKPLKKDFFCKEYSPMLNSANY